MYTGSIFPVLSVFLIDVCLVYICICSVFFISSFFCPLGLQCSSPVLLKRSSVSALALHHLVSLLFNWREHERPGMLPSTEMYRSTGTGGERKKTDGYREGEWAAESCVGRDPGSDYVRGRAHVADRKIYDEVSEEKGTYSHWAELREEEEEEEEDDEAGENEWIGAMLIVGDRRQYSPRVRLLDGKTERERTNREGGR